MSKWDISRIEEIFAILNVLCEERGIIFEGIAGKWEKGYTKLKLRCGTHGRWESTTLGNFITLGYGCEKCKRAVVIDKNRISDADAYEHFNKYGNFLTHTFIRDTENKTKHQTYPYWKVWCSVCAEDEFSKAGVSPDYFTSTTTHLTSGKIPCRCSKSYRWTEKELLYLIDKASIEKNYSVTDIMRNKDNKLVKTCKITYTCPEGHLNTTKVARYINLGRRCNKCRLLGSVSNGFYANRLDDLDYLYLLEFEDYGKIGRSFNPETRIHSFTGKAGNRPKEIRLFTGEHKDVYKIEQYILSTYRKVYVDWTKETVRVSDLQTIYDILKSMTEIKEVTHDKLD